MVIDIKLVNAIAVKAGKIILDIYNNADFTKIVDFKSDSSPLTLADKESNNYIVNELQKYYPEIPIISEEEKEIPYEVRKNWEYFWLVDPLDGTKEFIKKNGEFTVNIALMHVNRPVAGVIYTPVPEILYYAESGKGAFISSENGVQKLTANKKEKDLISIGSRSHSSSEEVEFLSKYPIASSVAIGSSLKFCLIAEGKADIYFRHGPTMEWDTAAGQIILEESGGKVLDLDNKPFTYNKQSLLNGSFVCITN